MTEATCGGVSFVVELTRGAPDDFGVEQAIACVRLHSKHVEAVAGLRRAAGRMDRGEGEGKNEDEDDEDEEGDGAASAAGATASATVAVAAHVASRRGASPRVLGAANFAAMYTAGGVRCVVDSMHLFSARHPAAPPMTLSCRLHEPCTGMVRVEIQPVRLQMLE